MNTNRIIVRVGDIYPNSDDKDVMVEISAEVAAALSDFNRAERNYARRQRYNRANGYIDESEDFACRHNLNTEISVEEAFENRLEIEALYHSINDLSTVQVVRLRRYYFDGWTMQQIADGEGVAVSSVYESIRSAVANLKKFLI